MIRKFLNEKYINMLDEEILNEIKTNATDILLSLEEHKPKSIPIGLYDFAICNFCSPDKYLLIYKKQQLCPLCFRENLDKRIDSNVVYLKTHSEWIHYVNLIKKYIDNPKKFEMSIRDINSYNKSEELPEEEMEEIPDNILLKNKFVDPDIDEKARQAYKILREVSGEPFIDDPIYS
jgi:hypothetical protein